MALADCLRVTGITPRYIPGNPSRATMETIPWPVDLYNLRPARSSIILVFMVSPGVTTATASATPAIRPAHMLPSDVVFPDASTGMNLRMLSNVKKRMADFKALEMQKAPLPVYIVRIPCSLIVDVRILIGDGLWALPLKSCWRVFRYSVGYWRCTAVSHLLAPAQLNWGMQSVHTVIMLSSPPAAPPASIDCHGKICFFVVMI